MCEFICLVLLDLVILWHYWKAGSKKQTDAAKILTNVHRKARARIIDEQIEEEEDRRAFMLKQQYNEFAADEEL